MNSMKDWKNLPSTRVIQWQTRWNLPLAGFSGIAGFVFALGSAGADSLWGTVGYGIIGVLLMFMGVFLARKF